MRIAPANLWFTFCETPIVALLFSCFVFGAETTYSTGPMLAIYLLFSVMLLVTSIVYFFRRHRGMAVFGFITFLVGGLLGGPPAVVM